MTESKHGDHRLRVDHRSDGSTLYCIERYEGNDLDDWMRTYHQPMENEKTAKGLLKILNTKRIVKTTYIYD